MGDLIRIGEASRLLGCHPDSIVYHEKRGNIRPFRNHAGVRFLTRQDLEKLKGMFTPKQTEELEHV